MKKYFHLLAIFFTVFFVYFGMSSKFTFKPKWALDYFNPLAQSIIHGHFDLVDPGTTYDLVHFRDKWYAPWGMLPALILIPLQLIRGQFIPTIYLTMTFASLNVVIVYLLLLRMKREFFLDMKTRDIYLLLLLFAFGTTQFYVGTLGSVWHVDQMVTAFFGTLGIFVIFKKKRLFRDYMFSSILFSMALLGRATIVLGIILPGILYLWEFFKRTIRKDRIEAFKRRFLIFGLPLLSFSIFFFLYNYARFQNPFEYGYKYIQEAPYLQRIRESNGILSLRNISTNLWYMIFEVPNLTFNRTVVLDFNLKGNSIFFLTPPFLAIFLTSPIVRKKKRFIVDPYITSLWAAVIVGMLPSLMIYSTGWMQFGFRYSLDITVMLLLLSVFGMKGRLNILYVLGILFSISMYVLGIQSLL